MTKEVTLPSGAELKITLPSFAVSKALYQALLEEAKAVGLESEKEVSSFLKDLFCIGFSSKKIEAALNECLKKSTYNGLRITDDVFESEEARGDYVSVCYEVANANISPFLKDLFALYGRILADVVVNRK